MAATSYIDVGLEMLEIIDSHTHSHVASSVAMALTQAAQFSYSLKCRNHLQMPINN